ncbi:MAG: YggS family pyridoxal phosphate-dependent enzyme, partial [Leptospiraceae bacterium]|nr:YggS family pyridoxal phosphate-dependent enzyme [Leptospiraceae bacterium]
IDRLSIAEKLENHLQKEGRSINVLIQVNSSYEESKFGMEPEKAIELLRSVSKLSCLRIKGLMTIGANTEEETLIRKSFQIIKNLQKQIIKEGIEGVSMDILSMGMSSDLELAIEEGSSLIRVGSAVFGNRG